MVTEQGKGRAVIAGAAALALLGGVAGAVAAVGLTYASWSPYHASALREVVELLEQERAKRAGELAGLAEERARAVAAAEVTADSLIKPVEEPLARAVALAEAARDEAVEAVAAERASLASVTSEVEGLVAEAQVAREAREAAAREQAHQAAARMEARLAKLPREIINSVEMKFVLIRPGTFTMGSAFGDRDAQPAHKVTLSQPYYLCVHEVTNVQWRVVKKKRPPSRWRGDDLPVDEVSWDETVQFCEALSALREERAAGRVYRLPTEAEWEYACRAGTTRRPASAASVSALP